MREKKRLLCSFFNADKAFDFLLSIGMRSSVESFNPIYPAVGDLNGWIARRNYGLSQGTVVLMIGKLPTSFDLETDAAVRT